MSQSFLIFTKHSGDIPHRVGYTDTTMEPYRCNSKLCDVKLHHHNNQTKPKASHAPPTLKNTTGHETTYPLLCSANEANGDDLRTPSLELGHPVGQGGLGCNDNVWSWNISHETHVPQQCYRLQSLAQALRERERRRGRRKKEKRWRKKMRKRGEVG